jgi:hypothetical protein
VRSWSSDSIQRMTWTSVLCGMSAIELWARTAGRRLPSSSARGGFGRNHPARALGLRTG